MKILNFGSLNIDNVYKVDKFLLPGETKSSLGFSKNCGGKGLNQSIAAAKAGNEVVHAAMLGNDGQMLVDALNDNGVDTTPIKAIDEASGHAIIQVDESGQNCILLYGGTNQMLTEEYIDSVLDSFGNNGLVLLQNETNLVGYIMDKAYEKGLQIALNAAPMNEKVLSYPLEKLTWLVVNEVEGKQIAGCEKDEDILDVLKKEQIPAAFFLVGNYFKTQPELVRRMVEEGHIVGNHTTTHPDMSKIKELADFRKELEQTENLYRETTGKDMPKFYRPPQGKFSVSNLQQAQMLGYTTVFWSLAYADWDNTKQPTREYALEKLNSRIHNGAIVLLHLTSKTNAEILEELIQGWKAQGYTFKPLTDLKK